jgi:glycerol uptake facilitator protein
MEREPTLARKLLAEFAGTALLVFIGAGSVQAAVKLDGGSGAKFSMADLGMIGFAFAFIIAANIFAIGRVSGCHINPAITIALAVTKRFPWVSVLPYLVAQYAGAILGGFLIFAVFLPDKSVPATFNLGVTAYAPNLPLQGFLAEALGTFILMLTVMGVAVDRRAPVGWAALTIGLIVAGVVIALGPASGQGINPARYFGSYINQWWFGGPLHKEQLWVYTTAPVVGSVIATLLYDFLNGREAEPLSEPEQVREIVSRETVAAPAR